MKDWIQKAQQGDGEAFVFLMETYKQSLYKIARSYFRNETDAEDALAQTVMNAWEKLHTLRKPAYFKTWLTRILLNNCNDILRHRRNTVALDTLPEREGAEDDHGDLYFAELMARLSPNLRIAMQLYYGEGFNTREISELLAVPVGTVTARLKRGRDILARLEKEDGIL